VQFQGNLTAPDVAQKQCLQNVKFKKSQIALKRGRIGEVC